MNHLEKAKQKLIDEKIFGNIYINLIEEYGFSKHAHFDQWIKNVKNPESPNKNVDFLYIMTEKHHNFSYKLSIDNILFYIDLNQKSIKLINIENIVNLLIKVSNISYCLQVIYCDSHSVSTVIITEEIKPIKYSVIVRYGLDRKYIDYIISPLDIDFSGIFFFEDKIYSFNDIDLFYKRCKEIKPEYFTGII